jgi:hypothetical protein
MPESNIEREVLDRLIRLEVKIDAFSEIKNQVFENQKDIIKIRENNEQQERDIQELRDHNKWLGRALGGACITSLVGIVVIFIKLGMGV